MAHINSLSELSEAYRFSQKYSTPDGKPIDILLEDERLVADGQEAPQDLNPDDQWLYGCIFGITGVEEQIIENLKLKFSLQVISPVNLRFHKKNGVYSIQKVRLFPGYLFFRTTDEHFNPRTLARVDSVIRLLCYDKEEWVMRGEDKQIAQELFRYNGLIGFSKGSFVDGRLRIQDGFLTRYQDEIIKVDKKHRTARARVRFNDRVMELWLGYDIEGDEWAPGLTVSDEVSEE